MNRSFINRYVLSLAIVLALASTTLAFFSKIVTKQSTTSFPTSLAFRSTWTSRTNSPLPMSPTSSMQLYALSEDMITKLEDMKEKYTRLGNTATPEADAERAGMEDLMDKYSTYKEIRKLMKKLGNILRNEASERRKAKQLKSFVELYKGRLEIEEILKEKMGVASQKQAQSIPELEEVLKWDAEIKALEKKLEEVQIVLPQGMSTRDERFRS